MSQLATALHSKEIKLDNPIDSIKVEREKKGLAVLIDNTKKTLLSKEEDSSKEDSSKEDSSKEDLSKEDSSKEDSSKEDTRMAPAKTPKKTAKKKVSMLTSPSHIQMLLGASGASGMNPVPYPMMSAYWTKIDYFNGMQETGNVVI